MESKPLSDKKNMIIIKTEIIIVQKTFYINLIQIIIKNQIHVSIIQLNQINQKMVGIQFT